MINVTQIRTVQQAMSYYEADDYYYEGEMAPSRWIGNGAEMLGLAGEVNRSDFRNMLAGLLPSGQQLGVPNGTEVQHNCGLDITISANKSVSIAVLIGGDEFLRNAHEEAVRETLEYLQEFAIARVRSADNSIERRSTGNFVVAAFDHVTSRLQDPNLHTHCLLMNVTFDKTSHKWRSLERREIFALQRVADEIYKQSIAARVLEAGYQIEQTRDGWELTGITSECRDLFSRRKTQIDEKLSVWGKERKTASAAVRERAALSTRSTKEKGVDHQELQRGWIKRAKEAGMRFEPIRENDRCVSHEERQQAATLAVGKAIEDLGERQARFTNIELEQRAIRAARATSASLADIRASIRISAQENTLEPRMVETRKGKQLGWASADGIRAETALLDLEKQGRNVMDRIMPESLISGALTDEEALSDYNWTLGQRSALKGILSCDNRVQGLQGLAGTAKTTTVLRSLAVLAEEHGLCVKGMAPTHAAAQQLFAGANLTSGAVTLKAHLMAEHYSPNGDGRSSELWIVDEASLVSTKEMVQLLRAANRADARVLLVGDVEQLGSIDAGEAFRQLQNSGMLTHVLDQIVRQKNIDARQAVYQSIGGDLKAAMNSIRRSGQIAEIQDKSERMALMASDYLTLTEPERKRTLVIEPTRAGRDELNQLIRDGLRKEGSLKGPELVAENLEKVDMSAELASDFSRYTENDFLVFSKDIKSVGIHKNTFFRIDNIDFEKRALTLRDDRGRVVHWLPHRAGSSRVEIYRSAPFHLCVGDSVTWTRNDRAKGLKNGQVLTVIASAGGFVKVAEPSGKEHLIDLSRRDGQHLRHSYCVTAHASQGLTADRVIAQLSDKNKDLVNQRSFYVSVSRARDEIRIYTENAAALVQHLEISSGVKQTALETVHAREVSRLERADDLGLG